MPHADAQMTRHVIPRGHTSDAAPDRLHDAGALIAQDHRQRCARERSVGDVEAAVAYAARRQSDPDLTGFRIVHLDVAQLHRFADGLQDRRFDCQRHGTSIRQSRWRDVGSRTSRSPSASGLKRKHRDEYRDPRVHGEPPGAAEDVLAATREDVAPRGGWRHHAEAEEAQGRLNQDRVRDHQAGHRHAGRERVG